MAYIITNNTEPGLTYSFPYASHTVISALVVATIAVSVIYFVMCWKRRKHKERREQLLISWSVGDTLTGLVLLGSLLGDLIMQQHCIPFVYCQLSGSLPIMFLAVPGIHLFIMSLERLLAVIYSVFHEIYWTQKHVWIYLGVIWGIILTTTGIAIFIGSGFAYQTYIFVVTAFMYISGGLLPLVIYIKILYTTAVHERNIHVTTTLTHEIFLHEVWISKLYMIKTIFFTILWMPFLVISFVKEVLHVPTAISDGVMIGLFSLGIFSGFLHTFFYILPRRSIALSCQKMLARLQHND